MTRIIFVDDEQPVLDGLENLLRKQRRVWNMTFALGGEAALREMEKQKYDVIVSDMCMPGMDGAALLQRVKTEYPSVVRIVLSGHADQDQINCALPLANQYLSKPCSYETLKAAIDNGGSKS